jgi:hypothetical protein
MIFESARQRLSVVKVSLESEVNDVYVCRDLRSSAQSLYTVIAVHDHTLVKQILAVIQESQGTSAGCFVDTFTAHGDFIMVFPYEKERPLEKFYMGEVYPITRCEDIALNILVACIGSGIPWQFLYLILQQGQVNISSNDEIFMGYQIDLKDFDPDMGEKDCVYACANILLKILEPQSSSKTISYQLLTRKTWNKSYTRFSELYRDIRIAAVPKSKRGFFARLRDLYMRNRDTLFGVLLRVSVVLLVIALLSLVSQILFGDILWLSFLINHFKIIGTENLAK